MMPAVKATLAEGSQASAISSASTAVATVCCQQRRMVSVFRPPCAYAAVACASVIWRVVSRPSSATARRTLVISVTNPNSAEFTRCSKRAVKVASLPIRSATSLVSTAGSASKLRSLTATGGNGGTFFKLAEMAVADLCMSSRTCQPYYRRPLASVPLGFLFQTFPRHDASGRAQAGCAIQQASASANCFSRA